MSTPTPLPFGTSRLGGQSPPIIAKGRARGEAAVVRNGIGGKPRTPTASTSAQPSPSTEQQPSTSTSTVSPPATTPGAKRRDAAKKRADRTAEAETLVVPPINVLIVEDNPINQNILSMFLRKKKIKHQMAKDGEEAVRKWRTGGFHLILLPVKDGIEATREIRDLERSLNIGVFPMTPASETPTRNLPGLPSATAAAVAPPPMPAISPLRCSVIIVALTASSLQTDRVNALAAGCNDFLTKPVSLKWLEKKIIEWGCMQALIDFDGWRRWKSADPKESGEETRQGFQHGPLAAAKSLAGRLKINPDRRSLRQSSTSSNGSVGTSNPGASNPTSKPHPPLPSDTDPDIVYQIAAPNAFHTLLTGSVESLATNDLAPEPPAQRHATAADDLVDARSELRVKAPDVPHPLKLENGVGAGDMPGVEAPPSLAEVSAGMTEISAVAASVEPDLESIAEGSGRRRAEEKPLPAIPPQ